MKDDDDDDENTSIHWFCLIPPPGELQRPHFQPWMKNLFEPLWRNPLLFHDDQKNTLCECWTLIWRRLGNVTAGMSSSLKSLNFIAQIQCLQGN